MNNENKVIEAKDEVIGGKAKKSSPLGVRIAKYVTALVVVLVLFWFGCTCEVREGETALIMRFGAVREEATEAGLYFKLPWPFESTVTYDARLQYLESNDLEVLTSDNKNLVIRSFVAWRIDDPVLYHNSVGAAGTAASKINGQVFNATNSTMGGYELQNLVSSDSEKLKIDQIQAEILEEVKAVCLESYGILIEDVSILRLSYPESTLEDVFEQMRSARQNEIDEIINNAYLTATGITTKAEEDAAVTRKEGSDTAADILKQAEADVAKIYNDAYAANVDLYRFLRNLDTLVSSVNQSSVMVININEPPFSVLLQYSEYMGDADAQTVIHDLSYILTKLPEADRTALINAIGDLIEQAATDNGITMPGE